MPGAEFQLDLYLQPIFQNDGSLLAHGIQAAKVDGRQEKRPLRKGASRESGPPRARLDRKILGYTPVFETGDCGALARWCRTRYGWSFPREELVFPPGVIPALCQLAEDLAARDEKILPMTPACGFIAHAAEYSGVELVSSPLRRMAAAFARRRAGENWTRVRGRPSRDGLSPEKVRPADFCFAGTWNRALSPLRFLSSPDGCGCNRAGRW